MDKYISKSALVAEIKRRIKINKECMLGLRNLDYYQGKVDALNDTISSLDTLEVKEVNLEKEISFRWSWFCIHDKDRESFVKVAKHFFELGMQQSKNHNNNEE